MKILLRLRRPDRRAIGATRYISFHREADSLESAIRIAVADVQKTGCVVERLQIEHDSPLLSSGAG